MSGFKYPPITVNAFFFIGIPLKNILDPTEILRNKTLTVRDTSTPDV